MQQTGFYWKKRIVRSTCFGHHYAHHQELKSYTDGCCLWYMALWFTGRLTPTHNLQLHTRPTTCKPKRHVPQTATVCITLELPMMGIIVPETCWADNKFCNKNRSVASSWPYISTYWHRKIPLTGFCQWDDEIRIQLLRYNLISWISWQLVKPQFCVM
jgi:hypothetical protein